MLDGLGYAHAAGRRAPRPQAVEHPDQQRRPHQDQRFRHRAYSTPPTSRSSATCSARRTTWRPSSSSASAIDSAADLYSVGVIAYELLTGSKTFRRHHRDGHAAGAERAPSRPVQPQPQAFAADRPGAAESARQEDARTASRARANSPRLPGRRSTRRLPRSRRAHDRLAAPDGAALLNAARLLRHGAARRISRRTAAAECCASAGAISLDTQRQEGAPARRRRRGAHPDGAEVAVPRPLPRVHHDRRQQGARFHEAGTRCT